MQRVVAGVACRFEERIADILAPGVVRMGLALGCNLSWSHMAFESLGLFHDQPDAEVVLDTVYLISIACALLTYLIVALVCHCGRKFAGSRSTCGLVSLSAAASTVVMHGATTTTAIGGACIVIGGIGSGVATSLFMMYFGIALSTMRTKRVMAISAIGYIVSTVLFSVYLFFEPFAAMVLCASMLPIAAALLVFGSMGAASGPCSQGETPPSRNLVSPEDCRQLKGLVRAFSVCMLVSGFVYEIARTVFIQVGGFAGETVENYAFAQGVVAALVLLAAIGITLVIVSSSNVHAPEICYRISACCLVVSALLILMPIVYPDASVVVPLAINNASFMCLNMLMWVLVCGVCNQLSDSSARFFALFRAAWTAGPLLGMLVVGGAGSLYMNPEHTLVLCDTPDFPEMFKPLAQAQGKALDELRQRDDVAWAFVSPAADFQAEGARTGDYLLAGEEFTVNDRGESTLSYADYAIAMVDEAERTGSPEAHVRERISVVGK